jgi:ABC-type nitrate/sulfonate/bicarbonate transport system permease component
MIRFGMNLPAPALLPIVIIVFGFGQTGKYALIVVGVVWPILMNSILAATSIDPVVIRTARALQLKRRTFILKVLIPAASPAIFSGLRIALSLSITLAVIAEMYTSSVGVGHAIVTAQRLFNIPGMWAGIVMLAIIGVGLNVLFAACEARVLGWHRGMRAHVSV